MPKWIKGYEGRYTIDEGGEITSHLNNTTRTMKPREEGGYMLVKLVDSNGVKHTEKVHRLLMLTFVDNPLNKRTVNHIDGNKLNNDLSNLEWSTHSEQHKHAIEIGLRPKFYPKNEEIIKAYRKSKCKFTLNEASDILEMKENYKMTNRAIAKLVGCDEFYINRLVVGKLTMFREEN